MTISTTTVSMSAIQTEFGGPSSNISMRNYYGRGSYVPDGTWLQGVAGGSYMPTSGANSFSNFQGAYSTTNFMNVGFTSTFFSSQGYSTTSTTWGYSEGPGLGSMNNTSTSYAYAYSKGSYSYLNTGFYLVEYSQNVNNGVPASPVVYVTMYGYPYGTPTYIRIGQQVLSIASTSSYSYSAGLAQYQWNATAISFPGLTTGTLVKVSIFNSVYPYVYGGDT